MAVVTTIDVSARSTPHPACSQLPAVARSGLSNLACPRCRFVLGMTSPDTLHVGPAVIKRAVKLICSNCGAYVEWYPAATTAFPSDHQ